MSKATGYVHPESGEYTLPIHDGNSTYTAIRERWNLFCYEYCDNCGLSFDELTDEQFDNCYQYAFEEVALYFNIDGDFVNNAMLFS